MSDKTIEIDEELQSELAKSIVNSEEFKASQKELAESAATAAADAVVKALDKPLKKDLGDGSDEGNDDGADDEGNKLKKKSGAGDGEKPHAAIAKMSKERRFFKAVQALQRGDLNALKQFNDFAADEIAEKAVKDGLIDVAQKAGYANEAVATDGQVLVPDPEFNTTVYNNLPKYGVVFDEGNVRTTDHNAVYALSLDSGLQFYQTSEAGVKTSGKLAFSRKLVSLLKYAVIVPATEELTEDAIVDYWQIVTNEISRAYGLVADQVTFTDSSMGILHATGIITQPLIAGGAGTNISWDDLLAAEGAVEDGVDTSNFKWYLRRETWFRLAQKKAAGSGEYLAQQMADGWSPNPNQPTTPWGTPVRFTRVLPKSTEVTANGGFAVYGDLKNYNFYSKNGMEIKMLTEATVKGSDGTDFNLATQDGVALRAVIRLLGVLPKGNAGKFVVVGTGTVS